jgi:hypothetical protein
MTADCCIAPLAMEKGEEEEKEEEEEEEERK